jgi:hypothetical protein
MEGAPLDEALKVKKTKGSNEKREKHDSFCFSKLLLHAANMLIIYANEFIMKIPL